jgi:hypothetical protein
LISLSQLAAGVSGRFIRMSLGRDTELRCESDPETCVETAEGEDAELYDPLTYWNLKIQCYTSTILAIILLFCFSSTEINSLFVDGWDYFSDPWNCVDSISITFNAIFLVLSTACIVAKDSPYLVFEVS